MSVSFRLPIYLCPQMLLRPCIHPLLLLTNLMMLHTLLCYCLTMVQEPDVGLVWSFWRTPHHHRRCPLLCTSITQRRCMASIRVPMHARWMHLRPRPHPLIGLGRLRLPRLGPLRRPRLQLGPSDRSGPTETAETSAALSGCDAANYLTRPHPLKRGIQWITARTRRRLLPPFPFLSNSCTQRL